jgi:hypothetical protein
MCVKGAAANVCVKDSGFRVVGEVRGTLTEWFFSHEQQTEECWLATLNSERIDREALGWPSIGAQLAGQGSERETRQEKSDAKLEVGALEVKKIDGILNMKIRGGLVDKWLPKHCSYHSVNKIFGCDGASVRLSHFTIPLQTIKSRPYRFNIGGECLGEHRTYELAAPDNASYSNWCSSISGKPLPATAQHGKSFLERLLPMEEVGFAKAILTRVRVIYAASFDQEMSVDGEQRINQRINQRTNQTNSTDGNARAPKQMSFRQLSVGLVQLGRYV